MDVLGPACDNAVTARPSRTIVRGSNDTWFKDCSSSSSDDGTTLPADFFNDTLAQLRTVFANAGIVRNNADDMLWRAIQSVGLRYAVDTGAANAMAVSCTPPVAALAPGLAIAIKAAHDVTGACTLVVDGLATKSVTFPGLAALTQGAWVENAIGIVIYDGTEFQLVAGGNSLEHLIQSIIPQVGPVYPIGSYWTTASCANGNGVPIKRMVATAYSGGVATIAYTSNSTDGIRAVTYSTAAFTRTQALAAKTLVEANRGGLYCDAPPDGTWIAVDNTLYDPTNTGSSTVYINCSTMFVRIA
jgi:hypothetical protein